jgi:hypothetical protein
VLPPSAWPVVAAAIVTDFRILASSRLPRGTRHASRSRVVAPEKIPEVTLAGHVPIASGNSITFSLQSIFVTPTVISFSRGARNFFLVNRRAHGAAPGDVR